MSRRLGWVVVVGAVAVVVAGCGGSGPEQGPIQEGTPTQVPVSPVASCPQGSEPDSAGSAAQARPSLGEGEFSASMDAESGVVVVVDGDDGTWTFDVCTNTWARQATTGSPPSGRPGLVYDAASDLTYAFGDGGFVPLTWSRRPGLQ